MNAEESARMKTRGRPGRGHEDELGVKPACDSDPPWRSVEILLDLGLSKEKIAAYHRRFPTPPASCGYRPPASPANSASLPLSGGRPCFARSASRVLDV